MLLEGVRVYSRRGWLLTGGGSRAWGAAFDFPCQWLVVGVVPVAYLAGVSPS